MLVAAWIQQNAQQCVQVPMVVALAVAYIFEHVHVLEVVVILELEAILDLEDALLLVQLLVRPVSDLEDDVSELVHNAALLDHLCEHVVVDVLFAVGVFVVEVVLDLVVHQFKDFLAK